MSGNHFMKIRAAAEQTGIAEGLLYDWVSKQKIAQKIGDDGVKMVSLDAVKAYRKDHQSKPRRASSEKGKVLSMQVTDAPVKLPGRERSASSSLLERREKINILAEKMLVKDKALTGAALHLKVKEAGIQAGNRLVYEVLNSLRGAAAKKKEAKTPANKRYGTFEYFCRELLTLKHDIQEHGVTSIQMTLDASGEPKWTVRRDQVVAL